MSSGDWTKDNVRGFVSGATVVARDIAGNGVQLPDWLRSEAAMVLDVHWSTQLAAMHSADRGRVGQLQHQALRHRGEVFETVCRTREDDGWHQRRMRVVNLLGAPDIEAVLWAIDQDAIVNRVEDEQHFDAVEAPPWTIHYVDANGLTIRSDGMTEQLFGRRADELTGKGIALFIHPDDYGNAVAAWTDVIAVPDTVRTTTVRLSRPDGTYVWAEGAVMNHLANDLGVVIITFHDISERRAREAALLASQQQSIRLADEFRTLAEHVPSAVFRAEHTGQVSFGNARWFDVVAPCGPVAALRDVAYPDDHLELDLALAQLTMTGGSDSCIVEVRSADGERTLALTLQAIGAPATDERTIIGTVQDVTSTARLRHLAETDALTGVWNRHSLDRHLDAALCDHRTGLLVIFIDLDGFKQVNDQHGHDAGDAVLLAVAQRLRRAVRPSDEIGRYGGDEFVIVCADTAAGAELQIRRRIERSLQEQINLPDGATWTPRASIGFARPHPGDDMQQLLQRADRAMYTTKQTRQQQQRTRTGP